MKKIVKFLVSFSAFLVLSVFLTGCMGDAVFLPSYNGQNDIDLSKGVQSEQIDVSNISSYENLVSTCKPAVVGIASVHNRYQSIGTGVSVSDGSYVLTNNHVIENGGSITLYLSNGTTASASVVWRDASSDLAMLKSSKPIPYLPLASSGSYDSGDEVIAIGTPLDLAFKHSATKGIISAVNRTISVDNDFGDTTLYNLIQHDASINPGNSGGPLINMKGEVIGINTVKVTDAEGMGFAIPVDTFRPVIQKISANGFYDTTYMGVFGYDYGLKSIGKVGEGFYVESVAKNSVAEIEGLKKGDIIVAIDGKTINLARDLKTSLYEHYVGDVVEITYLRDGVLNKAQLTLQKHPCC